MAVEVFIHKMSEHMETGRIIRWLAREGEAVEKFQVLMEVETDKVVAELEAPASGVLKGIRPGAVDGAVVKVGETIAFIAEAGEQVPALPPLEPMEAGQAAAATPAPPPAPSMPPAEEGPLRASPVARRVARELGVDLSLVRGTGPEGRINEEDVRAFAAASAAGKPSAPAAEESWLELTPAQRSTGFRMLESQQTAPQFSLALQADMSRALWLQEALVERARAQGLEHLSLTAILVKAAAEALKGHPRANATFEGGRIRLFGRINVGVAVGSEAGLVVPVIREADRKSLLQVAEEIRSYQEKARQMRFGAEDLMEGTFTLSNLGMYGIERFEAILNPPQSAILAVGKVVKTPLGMPDDTIQLRPTVWLTLTVDHRVMDGVQGARFLVEVKERLENPFFML